MPEDKILESEADLFQHTIGCALLLVVLAGLYHNVFLSAGDAVTGHLPSTHPLTALGFSTLAFAIFFIRQWERSGLVRNAISIFFVAASSVRVLEALYPENVSVFSGGPATEVLEAAGLYGRYSVETALFLMFCFGFELSRRNHPLVRLFMVAGGVGILSIGLVEVVFDLLLWGNELAFLTQLAMLLVSVDLIYRMRREVPFDSLFLSTRSSLIFQGLAVAVYVLPIVSGVVLLQNLQPERLDPLPVEVAIAGASWCLLCLTLIACAFYSRTLEHSEAEGPERYRKTSYRRRNK